MLTTRKYLASGFVCPEEAVPILLSAFIDKSYAFSLVLLVHSAT